MSWMVDDEFPTGFRRVDRRFVTTGPPHADTSWRFLPEAEMCNRLGLTKIVGARRNQSSHPVVVRFEFDDRTSCRSPVHSFGHYPEPIVFVWNSIETWWLGSDLTVDDEQFQRPVAVEIGNHRSRPEPIRFQSVTWIEFRPAVRSQAEEPVWFAETVLEQFDVPVVVEIGGDQCPGGRRA